MSAARPSRVAVVGLGYWGPNLVRVLADRQDVELSWLCDVEPERLAPFARRVPGARPTTDVQEVLDDGEVDAVLVATPVFTHFDLALRTMRAGKHVFVEKPLASSAREAYELRALADDLELTLMCGHTFLYSPPVRAVGRLLARGELGDVFFVSSSRVNLGLHQRDVSVIWDLAPHEFSILLYWFGELPLSVRAVGRDSIVPGIPDVAFVTLTFPSGMLANVELSWLAPSKLRRTVLVGSQKMVVYDDTSPEPIRIFDHGVVYRDPDTFGEYQLSYRTGDILSPRLDTIEPLAVQLGDFIASVRRERERIDGGLAGEVVRLVEAAAASLAEGGEEIPVGSSRLIRDVR